MELVHYYEHNLSPYVPILGVPYYWLVYSLGLVFVWESGRRRIKHAETQVKEKDFIDFLLVGWVCMLLGSRLFYVFVYNFSYFKTNPIEILYFWQGGMSFHGGLLGAAVGLFMLARLVKKQSFLPVSDLAVLSLPVVIGFGRLANFMNGELAGRVSYVPWAVVFPRYHDGLPRHPSQIYEALGEGLVIYLLLKIRQKDIKIPGRLTAYFIMLYALIRFGIEYVRQPDAQIGYIGPLGFTLGQYLCLAMFVLGLSVYCFRKCDKPNV